MKTKIFVPLLLLITGVCFIAACSKQENTVGLEKPLQTDARAALKSKKGPSVMDLTGKNWSIIRTEVSDISKSKKPSKKSDITTVTYYNEGEYTVHFDRYGSEPGFAQGFRCGPPTKLEKVIFDYSLSRAANTMVMYDKYPGMFQFTVLEIERIKTNGLRIIGTTNDIGERNYQKLVWDLVPFEVDRK